MGGGRSGEPAHHAAAFALGLAQLPLLINLAMSLWRGAPASDNPWEATTLEWQTGSPPPAGNFRRRRSCTAAPTTTAFPVKPRFVSQGDPG